MNKYITEENINFYDELFKSLDDITNETNKSCQITGLPLDNNFVTLECNHQFNYIPLYTEICKQKFNYGAYNINNLSPDDSNKINGSGLDYFIKCPYCRNIQFTILPYYDDLKLKKIYGINTLDLAYYGEKYIKNVSFMYKGLTFQYGQCCREILTNNSNPILCKNTNVTKINNTDLTYCVNHYATALKEYKLILSIQKKNALKQKKENYAKQLEELNLDRVAKGLKPLKHLPKTDNSIETSITITNNGCKAILKTGINKGSQCGCMSINQDGLCKRHVSK